MKKFSMKFLPNGIKASMKTCHYQVVFALETQHSSTNWDRQQAETSEPKPHDPLNQYRKGVVSSH